MLVLDILNIKLHNLHLILTFFQLIFEFFETTLINILYWFSKILQTIYLMFMKIKYKFNPFDTYIKNITNHYLCTHPILKGRNDRLFFIENNEDVNNVI